MNEEHALRLLERSRVEDTNALDAGYACEVDAIDSNHWHELMLQFADASFYQTWSFGSVHSGERHLSHLVLKNKAQIVGMSQARIVKVPGLPVGFAYVTSGPMWRSGKRNAEVPDLRNLLRALYQEYVLRRQLFLRVSPSVIDSDGNAFIRHVFTQEGFAFRESPDQTVVLDLLKPLQEIRNGLGRKWRQTLQSAEKKDLRVIEGKGDTPQRMALEIFRSMKARKRFFGGNQSEAIEIDKQLPDPLKLQFTICTHAGEPVAALAWVTFGSVGMPLVSATADQALKLNASYVLWWKMIEYYKANGFVAVDMAGVNEQRNPGGYYFKTHILGKDFRAPNRYLGHFDACLNPSSERLFRGIEVARGSYRRIGRQLAARKSGVVGR